MTMATIIRTKVVACSKQKKWLHSVLVKRRRKYFWSVLTIVGALWVLYICQSVLLVWGTPNRAEVIDGGLLPPTPSSTTTIAGGMAIKKIVDTNSHYIGTHNNNNNKDGNRNTDDRKKKNTGNSSKRHYYEAKKKPSTHIFNPHRLKGDRLLAGVEAKIKELTEEYWQCEDKEPFIRMLLLAPDRKVEITPQTCQQLPTKSSVNEMWGGAGGSYDTEPIVYGLDTCETYRQMLLPQNNNNGTALNPKPRVAGLYHTGTNALNRAFNNNLKRVYNNPHVSPYEVPWGKHLPPNKYRLTNSYPVGKKEDRLKVLPIVIIRDPYYWFQSMCKTPYDVKWDHQANNDKHCPNFIMPNKTTYKVSVSEFQTNYTTTDEYESLAKMWSDYYMEYMNADYPRLIIRFEDTLYRMEKVINIVKECIGKNVTDYTNNTPFRYMMKKPKIHGNPTDFLVALKKYSDSTTRYDGLSNDDIKYLKQGVLRPKLMKTFRYYHASIEPSTEKEGVRFIRKVEKGKEEYVDVSYSEFEASYPNKKITGKNLYVFTREEKATNLVFDLSEEDDAALGATPPTKNMYLTILHTTRDGGILSKGDKYLKHEFGKLDFEEIKELSDDPYLHLLITIEDADVDESSNNTTTNTTTTETTSEQ